MGEQTDRMDSMLTDLVSILPALSAWSGESLASAASSVVDVGVHVAAQFGAAAHHAAHILTSVATDASHAATTAVPTAPTGAVPAPSGSEAEVASGFGAWIEPYVRYGPWAIMIIFILSGVGLHLSEDLILIPAGILIASGKLDWTETLIAAYIGLVIGDLLWLTMCRRFGTKMVQSRWFKRVVHPRRLLEAKHQMEERGILVVVLARFVPGTRTPVITMAGILHLKMWKLVVVELITCAITVPLQVGMGYLAAIGMGEAKSTGEFIVKLVAITAAFVLAGVALHWWLSSRKRAGRAPRSKAAWLRTFGRRRREQSVHAPVGPVR